MGLLVAVYFMHFFSMLESDIQPTQLWIKYCHFVLEKTSIIRMISSELELLILFGQRQPLFL